jgi:Cytochrome P460
MRISKTNLVAGLLICSALLAATAGAIEYNSDGKMLVPKDYREWIFLSSGLGMTYTPSSTPNPNPSFDNVFVNPEAYQSYLKSGAWPDKTVLILEIRASDSKVSINKDGRVQGNVVGVEAHVKDASHGGWAFYNFGNGSQQVGTLLPKTATCFCSVLSHAN